MICNYRKMKPKAFSEVSAVKFGIMSPEEIISQSVVEVEHQEIFDSTFPL